MEAGQQDVVTIAELIERLNWQTQRLQELERFVLTFRQAHLIMLGGGEDFLHLPRSVEPKHRRR
jgi:hypothetical protein